VTKYKDLDVLGAVIRRACQEASRRAGNQGEEKEHPRMLWIGELEDESEFPIPTGSSASMRSEVGNRG
jgi:hypothetical protein